MSGLYRAFKIYRKVKPWKQPWYKRKTVPFKEVTWVHPDLYYERAIESLRRRVPSWMRAEKGPPGKRGYEGGWQAPPSEADWSSTEIVGSETSLNMPSLGKPDTTGTCSPTDYSLYKRKPRIGAFGRRKEKNYPRIKLKFTVAPFTLLGSRLGPIGNPAKKDGLIPKLEKLSLTSNLRQPGFVSVMRRSLMSVLKGE